MLNNSLRILIVDDSTFFRHRLVEIIQAEPDLQVIGTAANGKEAIEKVAELHPDLVTMDVQMPVVDGISAVRQIMAEHPTRILMLSALTKQGARETLDSLEAGAIDFLSKDGDYRKAGATSGNFTDKFLDKIRTVSRSQLTNLRLDDAIHRSTSYTHTAFHSLSRNGEHLGLVVIGASTGGPNALQVVLKCLPRSFSLPVLVAVHMPAGFTTAYAERLDNICAVKVREATDLAPIRAGQILIAPGGKQMTVSHGASGPQVRIKDASPEDVYHPSVDKLFTSAAITYKNKALGVIMTGMGSDGLEGSRRLKAAGARLWCQDKDSCVVYGMPQAVVGAGLSDRILPIEELGPQLTKQL